MAIVTYPGTDASFLVHAQLPENLRSKLAVRIESDAYMLAAKAHFWDRNGRKWVTTLETQDVNGVPVQIKIPDAFLSFLCTVV